MVKQDLAKIQSGVRFSLSAPQQNPIGHGFDAMSKKWINLFILWIKDCL